MERDILIIDIEGIEQDQDARRSSNISCNECYKSLTFLISFLLPANEALSLPLNPLTQRLCLFNSRGRRNTSKKILKDENKTPMYQLLVDKTQLSKPTYIYTMVRSVISKLVRI